MDENYLLNVLKYPQSLISNNCKVVKCANGTTLVTKGTVSLNVSVGLSRGQLQFVVIEKLFPRIIVGIRSMKTLNIQLRIADNCVYSKGVMIPFM